MERNEAGNAFFIILMAVILFAALAFTFSKGAQQGGENVGQRQAQLAATDIIDFSQKTERVVSGMLQNGHSEGDIDFIGMNDNYTNSNCSTADCQVFSAGGGSIAPVYPMANWLNSTFSASDSYGTWFISAKYCVPGVPDNTCSAPKGNDLVMVLPYLNQTVCEAINDQLNIANPPPEPTDFGGLNNTGRFDGSYTPAGGATLWVASAINGKYAACLHDGSTGAYNFYSVIIAR